MNFAHTLYRVVQEEKSTCWEVILSVNVRKKKFMPPNLQFGMVKEIQLFGTTNTKALRIVIKKNKLLPVDLIFNLTSK
jgi:hypothetical protein